MTDKILPKTSQIAPCVKCRYIEPLERTQKQINSNWIDISDFIIIQEL